MNMLDEPRENQTLVMVGNLDDAAPWNIEIWMRAEVAAQGSTGRWYRTGTHDTGSVHAMSWERLNEYARDRDSVVRVLLHGLR